ncbi:hypothetical protein K1719_033430 [Acacia pycnantha]|nr:hypothetical protein K1719_033430 [Acacia pycnantha]
MQCLRFESLEDWDMLLSVPDPDSKTLREEKREELFDNLKGNESIGWAADVLCPRELSAKMLKREQDKPE